MFRAARDALPNDPVAQERIVGSLLAALAIADVRIFSLSNKFLVLTGGSGRLPSEFTRGSLVCLVMKPFSSIWVSVVGLPKEILLNPAVWNAVAHGNITFVVVLFSVR